MAGTPVRRPRSALCEVASARRDSSEGWTAWCRFLGARSLLVLLFVVTPPLRLSLGEGGRRKGNIDVRHRLAASRMRPTEARDPTCNPSAGLGIEPQPSTCRLTVSARAVHFLTFLTDV